MECRYDSSNCCLPDPVECANLAYWNEYLAQLYIVFCKDFKNQDDPIYFNSYPLYIKREPLDVSGYEHAFIHCTHKSMKGASNDPNDRIPDLERAKRLPWIKRILYKLQTCVIKNKCDKFCVWEERFRGYIRVNILDKGERFLVIIEKRKSYYLLITSFYLDSDIAVKKRIVKYERYLKQKTPLT